jgi:hypothetical protein
MVREKEVSLENENFFEKLKDSTLSWGIENLSTDADNACAFFDCYLIIVCHSH